MNRKITSTMLSNWLKVLTSQTEANLSSWWLTAWALPWCYTCWTTNHKIGKTSIFVLKSLWLESGRAVSKFKNKDPSPANSYHRINPFIKTNLPDNSGLFTSAQDWPSLNPKSRVQLRTNFPSQDEKMDWFLGEIARKSYSLVTNLSIYTNLYYSYSCYEGLCCWWQLGKCLG